MRRGRKPERYRVMLRFFSCVEEITEIDKLRKFIDKYYRRETIEESKCVNFNPTEKKTYLLKV